MQDERVRQRVRLRDAVGGECEHSRPFEDAERRRSRGKDHREPGRDEDEEPGGRRKPEVEPEHDEPEGHAQEEPGEKRPEKGGEAEARASQPDEAVQEVPRQRLHPLRKEEREPTERSQHEPERALAVHPEDDDRAEEKKRERYREGAGDAKPGHLRQPGKRDEEEQEERKDVEEPLDDDGSGGLRPRPAAERVQSEDAGRVAGAKGEDVVEELTDEKRLRRRPEGGPGPRGEEEAPPECANEERQGKRRERGSQQPVVALPKRRGELVELDVPYGEVPEDDRDGDPERGVAVPGPRHQTRSPHLRCSEATQARL
jgi:hypothetical protein